MLADEERQDAGTAVVAGHIAQPLGASIDGGALEGGRAAQVEALEVVSVGGHPHFRLVSVPTPAYLPVKPFREAGRVIARDLVPMIEPHWDASHVRKDVHLVVGDSPFDVIELVATAKDAL